jgi:periplasmic divalent cation tolerance protein
MDDFIVVYVTTGSREESHRIARTLVEERLAACVNCLGSVRSVYHWQGNVEQSEEELLVIKTRRDLFRQLNARIQELHSYAVPEIIALPILEGSESYLKWLEGELSSTRR